jgi:hypothetical protein
MGRITFPILRVFVATLSVVVGGVATASELPFEFANGFIRIEARVAQSAEPLHLLLDSGAEVSLLSLRTARRLHLKLGTQTWVTGVDAESVAYRVNGVRVMAGKVPLGEPLSWVVDLPGVDNLCGAPVDGIVGVEFFRDRVVQIDYGRRCLRVLSQVPTEATVERLPLLWQRGVLCAPVMVNGSQPRWTRLDTGCNDALHWVVPRAYTKVSRRGMSLGFVTDPRDTTLTTVSLGGQLVSPVKTALHGRPLFPGEAGLLGNALLSRFGVVTIDTVHHQLLLHHAPKD